MRNKIELFLCRLWLRWERARFDVYHDKMFQARTNIETLEKLEENLSALIEMERSE